MNDDIKSLPPLPESIQKIQQLCAQPEVDMSKLTKVIEGDPMLSANILKSVNSPLYGMSKEIVSIHQAVMLFGVSMIRGFAAANAIKKSLSVDLAPYETSIERLSEISALQLALVREWFGNVDKSRLNLLTSGAFLMELGKIITSKRLLLSGASKPFTKEISEGEAIWEAEKHYLNTDSYAVAAAMFEHWNFDKTLVDAIASISFDDAQENGAVLRAISRAINLRAILEESGVALALEIVERGGLDKEPFVKAVERIRERMGAQKGNG